MKKLMFAVVATFSIACAYGAGFGIYEASARGNAMGGAVVGDVSDATANYHNPANLAFSTNIMLQFMQETGKKALPGQRNRNGC